MMNSKPPLSEVKHTEFSKKVLALIKAIPKGKVATYGLIAKLAGKPRGSREVGWLLHSCTKSHKLPWQRVIKSSGQLSFPPHSNTFFRQSELLKKEGIFILNGRVDLKKFLWDLPPFLIQEKVVLYKPPRKRRI